MSKVKRIGVLTSGGDAPGMNAAVRAVVRTALANGIECVGIRRGWQGLINGDFMPLSRDSVGHILSRGGTMLYTARSDEFMTESGRKKAVNTCKMLGLEGIVAIGGDGTFRGALELSRLGIPVVGVPATIDNDVGCTNYTIGFDTACNTAIECIDRLRDTMQSHERCSVVEVMGRNAGFLALYVGIAVGATAVLVPEREIDFQKDVIERIQDSRLAGNTHFMIVVAEGAGQELLEGAEERDASGNILKKDIGEFLKRRISAHFKEKGFDASVKYIDPSYIIRSCPAKGTDAIRCYELARAAVHAAMAGRTDCVVGNIGESFALVPIALATIERQKLDTDGQSWRSVLDATGQEFYFNGVPRNLFAGDAFAP